MRHTQLLTKTRKEAPKDEVSKNAELLIRAGYIHKEMAGVYDYLPLGVRVLNKIKKVISNEMEKIGSIEISMSTLQSNEVWQKTDRWNDQNVDVWFKSKLKNGTEVGFGWSHEEPITEMMKSHIFGHKDLPKYVHQFQNKLRNEERAKSGIMRCREFVMKDMYAFSATKEDNDRFYEKATHAYMDIFKKVGLGDVTYITSASGGVFTHEFSHEFQTLSEAGEDVVYVNTAKGIALNEEVFNQETLDQIKMKESDFEKKKAIEVGNIFNFGTDKSEHMELFVTGADGKKQPVYLSSYGIGVTRLMGTIVEVLSDAKGIVWPESVAPFTVHLIGISGNEETKKVTEKMYDTLSKNGVEVLFDDRDARPGEKFADSDLMGIPWRVVVSDKTLAAGGFELKKRTDEETKIVSEKELLDMCMPTGRED